MGSREGVRVETTSHPGGFPRLPADDVEGGVVVVIDETFDRFFIDIRDDYAFYVSDGGYRLDLSVRLRARAYDTERRYFLAREVPCRNARRSTRTVTREGRSIDDCKRKRRFGVGVDDDAHDRRKPVFVGVVRVGVDPLYRRSVVVSAYVGRHRTEVAVVLREIDVRLRRHLGVLMVVRREGVLYGVGYRGGIERLVDIVGTEQVGIHGQQYARADNNLSQRVKDNRREG